MSKTPITPVIRGHVDLFQLEDDGRVRLRGWVARDDTPIDRIDIALQGNLWASGISLHERPDVKTALEDFVGSCPHILLSGFDVIAPLPERVEAVSTTVVEITPYTPSDLRLDVLRTYFCDYQDQLENMPQPPALLRDRVGGSENFVQAAAQIASLLMTCLAKYEPRLDEAGMILDWGCACGRVIAQMMKFVSPKSVHGCDIDAEAILWDRQNVRGPSFTQIAPYPPTNYSDGTFDVVYGISVMTHLDEQTQMLWLKELKRITRPGALLALTIIGERLKATNMPASLAKEFSEKGFASFVPNYSGMLTKFVHAGYYRETYHSLGYIESNWGRYFDVLEYVETKDQDVVMLRTV